MGRDFVYGTFPVYHLIAAGLRRIDRIHFIKGSKTHGSMTHGSMTHGSMTHSILEIARQKKIPVREGRPLFDRFTDHQGVVAETEAYPYKDIRELLNENWLLVLDGIQDPQNLGAICRTARIIGVGGVVIRVDRAVGITPGVCKAAAGAVEYLKIASVTNLSETLNFLKESGYWIYGADQEGEKSLYEELFPGKVVVVIGSEGQGLSRLVGERCDIRLKIPMRHPEIGSYNASVSTALILAEIARQSTIKKMGRP